MDKGKKTPRNPSCCLSDAPLLFDSLLGRSWRACRLWSGVWVSVSSLLSSISDLRQYKYSEKYLTFLQHLCNAQGVNRQDYRALNIVHSKDKCSDGHHMNVVWYRTWFNISRFYWKPGFGLWKKFIQHNLRLCRCSLPWCQHHHHRSMNTLWEGVLHVCISWSFTTKAPNCQLAPN